MEPVAAGVELTGRVGVVTGAGSGVGRAIAEALAAAAPGDVVVLAGKGHETGQTFAHQRTVPFDDRVVAREELGTLGWN